MSEWDFKSIASLNEILANLYPFDTDARRIAKAAGLNTARITFENKAISTWFNVLEYSNPRGQVDAIVGVALEENPDNEPLKSARDRAPPPVLKGPEARNWNGPRGGALEQIMGQKSTLVPITYLEVGLERSKSVVRVKHPDGSSGSGFMTEGGLLITNNHVLPTAERAKSAVIQFNYQQTAGGLSASIDEAGLDIDTFRTSIDDDWSAVRVTGDLAAKWGQIPLRKTSIAAGDHVNIIQHPGGGPKQISVFANVVVFVGEGCVQYLTDTLPGSSGSPVFDANWNVVALHHSGGWLLEPNTPSKMTYYRNEGISIDRVIDGLGAR